MIELPFGNGHKSFPLPKHSRILEPPSHHGKITKDSFRKNLEQQLFNKNWDFSEIAIVVADKTRLCDYPLYLPVLLNTLEIAGAHHSNISIYIAYGMHKPHSQEESLAAYGQSFKDCRWVHHDSQNNQIFEELGETSRGTKVMVRKDILNASMRITFGAISHHYFAGYGGGRKLLFPGLGAKEAIFKNHSLFLDNDTKRLHNNCQLGKLEENPLALDLQEIYNFCPAHLSIHGIMDNHGKVCDILVGTEQSTFLEATRRHSQYTEIRSDKTFDLVVASCGGYPKDINLVQSHKAFHNAALWVKDNGHLIIVSQCQDGVGSETFLPWFAYGSRDEAFARLSKKFIGNGGTALCFMEKLDRIKVSYITDLDELNCRKVGVQKITEESASQLINEAKTCAFIPNASILVKR